MSKKFYKTTIELGVFNYKELVVYASSPQDAIDQIKSGGYRFSLYGENVSDISDILYNLPEGKLFTFFDVLPVEAVVTVNTFIFFCCCIKAGKPGIPLKLTFTIKFSFSDDTFPPTINPKNES